jgi:hypothetical protein
MTFFEIRWVKPIDRGMAVLPFSLASTGTHAEFPISLFSWTTYREVGEAVTTERMPIAAAMGNIMMSISFEPSMDYFMWIRRRYEAR